MTSRFAAPARPTLTVMGSTRALSAKALIFTGMVAENISVCLWACVQSRYISYGNTVQFNDQHAALARGHFLAQAAPSCQSDNLSMHYRMHNIDCSNRLKIAVSKALEDRLTFLWVWAVCMGLFAWVW